MWNRKQRRIEELEDQLSDALLNMVNVTVPMPPNVSQVIASARKGTWYAVRYQFRVGATWPTPGSAIDFAEVGMFEQQRSEPVYFDGSQYGWEGELQGD